MFSSSTIGRSFLLVLAMALVPLLMPASASAQTSEIDAVVLACDESVNHYQIQLQSGARSTPAGTFPQSVTVHFADGSSTEATAPLYLGGNTIYYRSTDVRDVALTGATAEWNTTAFPNYTFTVTAHPCVAEPTPTHSVAGAVVQRGNEKPIANLTVCLEGVNNCTTTAADGSFTFTGLEDGTYTLTTTGSNWKPQTTTVTVVDSDVFVTVVQKKGGGN